MHLSKRRQKTSYFLAFPLFYVVVPQSSIIMPVHLLHSMTFPAWGHFGPGHSEHSHPISIQCSLSTLMKKDGGEGEVKYPRQIQHCPMGNTVIAHRLVFKFCWHFAYFCAKGPDPIQSTVPTQRTNRLNLRRTQPPTCEIYNISKSDPTQQVNPTWRQLWLVVGLKEVRSSTLFVCRVKFAWSFWWR